VTRGPGAGYYRPAQACKDKKKKSSNRINDRNNENVGKFGIPFPKKMEKKPKTVHGNVRKEGRLNRLEAVEA